MFVAEANIFGRLVKIDRVLGYGDNTDFLPGNYAEVVLDNAKGPIALVPTDQIFIRKAEIRERLAVEMDSMLGEKDERGFYRGWSI